MKIKADEKSILRRIAESFSREKDLAQRNALEFEIQFQLGCSWGKALCFANEIRIRNYKIS